MPGGPPIIPMRLQPLPEFKPFEQPVIAHDKVRYVGEPIAVVLADSVAIGEDALEAIEVEIEDAAGGRRLARRRARTRACCSRRPGTNRSLIFEARKGDADAAFANAPYVRREPLRTGRHYGLTMEPRGVMAEWDAAKGRLTVSGAAKVPFFNRRILAKQIGLPDDADRDDRERRRRRLRRARRVLSGGFPDPVRGAPRQPAGEVDRGPPREPDGDEPRARGRGDLEIACERDGTILALRGEVHTDMGAYMRTNGAVGARNIAQFMAGPYRVPHVKLDSSLWMTNKTPVGTYRGPGRFEANFFLERMLDMVAADLGIDRVEFRRTQPDDAGGAALSDRALCSRPTPRTSTTAATTARRSTAA